MNIDKAAEKQTLEEAAANYMEAMYGSSRFDSPIVYNAFIAGAEYALSLQVGAEKILEFAKGEEKEPDLLLMGKVVTLLMDKLDPLDAAVYAKRIIELALQSKPEPGREEWISVKERLPENEQWVWVAKKFEHGYDVMLMAHQFYQEFFNKKDCFVAYGEPHPYEGITHYRSLPNPPKPTEK